MIRDLVKRRKHFPTKCWEKGVQHFSTLPYYVLVLGRISTFVQTDNLPLIVIKEVTIYSVLDRGEMQHDNPLTNQEDYPGPFCLERMET